MRLLSRFIFPLATLLIFHSGVGDASIIRARDACTDFADRTFRIYAYTQDSLGAITHNFQAEVEHGFDPKKPLAGPELSSCTAGVGSGCRWEKSETSELDDYKITHGRYDPYSVDDGDVILLGNGCDDQILQCTGETASIPIIGDPSVPPVIVYNSAHKCAVRKPDHAVIDEAVKDAIIAATLAEVAAEKNGDDQGGDDQNGDDQVEPERTA